MPRASKRRQCVLDSLEKARHKIKVAFSYELKTPFYPEKKLTTRMLLLERMVMKIQDRQPRGTEEREERGRHVECSSGVLHWTDERLAKTSITNPKFGTCCRQGPPLIYASC